MKYKVVLFDYDGVCFTGTQFSDQLHREYGTEFEAMQPFFSGPFKQCTLGNGDLKDILPTVIEAWKWPGTADELMAYWFKDDVIEAPILACIEQLRAQGVRCFMATNQEKYRAASLREKFGHGKVFEEIFASSEIGHIKNDPVFWDVVYAKIAALADNDKSKVLFLDDAEDNVITARAFGFDAIHYKGPEDLKGLDLSAENA